MKHSPRIEIFSNDAATWHQLIQESKERHQLSCDPQIDHYLALMLEACNQNKLPLNRNIAQHFLLAAQTEGRVGIRRLQSVGDQCLLIAGMFPHLIERKQVNARYIDDIGRIAYHSIAVNPGTTKQQLDPELFNQLSYHFKELTQLLSGINTPPTTAHD